MSAFFANLRMKLHSVPYVWPDVAPVDGDVLVPVGAALLVPEPSRVHQLVHHNPLTVHL